MADDSESLTHDFQKGADDYSDRLQLKSKEVWGKTQQKVKDEDWKKDETAKKEALLAALLDRSEAELGLTNAASDAAPLALQGSLPVASPAESQTSRFDLGWTGSAPSRSKKPSGGPKSGTSAQKALKLRQAERQRKAVEDRKRGDKALTRQDVTRRHGGLSPEAAAAAEIKAREKAQQETGFALPSRPAGRR